GCCASVGAAGAGGPDRPPGTTPKNIVFEKSTVPGKGFRYGEGTFRTSYDADGRCRLDEATYLMRRYEYRSRMGWSGKFATGDVFGTLGGLFRANCSDPRAVLERIPDEDLPRGVKVPAWDSLTVPLYGGGGFDHIGLNVSEIARKDQGEATAVLQIH